MSQRGSACLRNWVQRLRGLGQELSGVHDQRPYLRKATVAVMVRFVMAILLSACFAFCLGLVGRCTWTQAMYGGHRSVVQWLAD